MGSEGPPQMTSVAQPPREPVPPAGALARYRAAGVVPRLVGGSAVLALLLVAVCVVSLGVGAVAIPVSHVIGAIASYAGWADGPQTPVEQQVVVQLRLPRIVVGAMVGASLGLAGSAMQGLFRNPLADPGIIGVSSGGAAAAVVAIVLGLHDLFFLALPTAAFLGALAAALLVYALAVASGQFSAATLLLAGVAVNAFLGAVISAVMVMTPSDEVLRSITFWLAGGLDARRWEHVAMVAPFTGLGGLALIAMARDLNLLMLGDDDARSLGVRVTVSRALILGAGALVTGSAVAVSGTIAFVGLATPHMVRMLAGSDHRALLPLSALGGAVFLVAADTVARAAAAPAELPVGVVTSFVGAPFFLVLLLHARGRVEAL